MVLNDAEASPEGFPDQGDKWSSESTSSDRPNSNMRFRHYPTRIDESLFPQVSALGSLMMFKAPGGMRDLMERRLQHRYEDSRRMVNRELTQPETDVLVEITGSGVYWGRIGYPIGFIIGLYRDRRMLLGPHGIQTSWVVAKHDPWRAMGRLAYVSAKASFWSFGVGMLLAFSGVVGEAYRLNLDPRLEQFRMDVLERRKKMMGERGERDPLRAPRSQTQSLPQGQQQQQQEQHQGGKPSSSDPAPVRPDPPMQTYDSPAVQSTSISSTMPTADPAPAPVPASSATDYFDDASPSAPDYQTGANTGSAWDRVRGQVGFGRSDGQTSQPFRTPAQQPRESAPFAKPSSSSEQDSQAESSKEQARREFDRMMDAESRGVDDMTIGDVTPKKGGAWGRRW